MKRKDYRTDIEFIEQVFLNMVSDNARKLQNGMNLRKEIVEKLEAGEDFSNYRTKWIRATACKMVDVLKTQAIAFNTENDDDRISSLDLIDACATLEGMLKGTVQ